MRRVPSRSPRALAAVLLLLALAVGDVASASAAGPRTARATVTSKPGVITTGERAAITVAVRAPSAGRRRLAVTALLQSSTSGGRAFRTIATRRFARRAGRRMLRTRLVLNYRAPARAGIQRLRVRVRVGRRTITTRAFRIRVVATELPRPERPVDVIPAPPPRTLVLAPQAIRAVPAPGEPGVLRVSGPVDARPGDFVSAGLGETTPFGFLGRVVAVRTEGDETVLSTEPAALPDAVPEADLSTSFVAEEIETEREDQLSRRAGGARTSTMSSSAGRIVHVRARRAFECGAGGEVKVRAVVGVRPEVDLSASWRLFRPPNVRFVARIVGTAELSATASAQADCTLGPIELFSRRLAPIQFTVGPIPVVIVPVLRVSVTGIGRVDGSVKSEVAGSVTAEAGINYEDGEAKPIGDLRRNFGFTPPSPDVSGELGATASPTLDALLYGAAGPSASLNVGLKAVVTPLEEVRWRLLLPVSLTAKLHAPVLKVSTGDLTVFSREFLLAQDGGDGDGGDGGGGHPELPLTFDEFPEGTFISDQYQHVGIRFTSEVMTTSDGANPTSPVLSGMPRFQGPIEAEFVDPSTGQPATVNRVQFDAGYIDSPGSVEIVATTASGRTIRAVADDEGIDEIFLAANGIRSFVARTVSDEPAGFAIDNLDFG